MTRFGVAALLAVTAALVALARGLPAHTFYVGDPGVKLIAARNAIATPGRALEIPLPEIGGEPAAYVDPFFIVHGDHTHAITPDLFPLASAPFIALFGLRGAYILPAAGLLLALGATAWLAVLLDPRRSPAAVVLTTFVGTPLLFYGLEFWEHAPAAGLAISGVALFVRELRARDDPSAAVTHQSRPEPTAAVPLIVAGLLLGVAVLLRPEALWFAVAVVLCSRTLRSRPSGRALALVAGGIVAALLPLELYTVLHFGTAIPPHIAGNPALASGDWVAIRQSVLASWFVSGGTSNFWRVAPAVLLGVMPLVRSLFFPTGSPHQRRRRSGGGRDRHGRSERGQRFLGGVALVTLVLAVLTAPNDGGGQWGPRYLLLAYPPLAILSTDSLWYVVSGVRRTLLSRAQRIFAAFAVAAVVSLVVGSAYLQRASYKELRGAKLTYARLVDFVARETAPERYVVTDLWWIDQAAASIADSRTFLVVRDRAAAAEALARLDRAREPAVTVIRSRVESTGGYESWLEGSCYRPTGERETPEGLVAVQLRRACDP